MSVSQSELDRSWKKSLRKMEKCTEMKGKGGSFLCPVPKKQSVCVGRKKKKKEEKIKERNGPKEATENGILTRKIREKLQHTLCVVHADRRVVIDRRFPEQCIIRVVSAMRTKQSIGYKMISHGSWSSPIERQRKKTTTKKRSIRQMWHKKKGKKNIQNDNS